MIILSTFADLGYLLRDARENAGLSIREFAERAYLTRSGVSKREQRGAMKGAPMLIQHAAALGYAVALVPERHIHYRQTGTGWPA